ncbi:hypothetical protein JW977_04770 [Candidatus Falkowbacteria bacterium]|nr:hypothetical protein [Candidatus Falkowbacteria bacterium]
MKKTVIIFCIILAIIIIGIVGYYLFFAGEEKYSSPLGLSFEYPATSAGRSELATSGVQKIKVKETATNDGSQISIGTESSINNGVGDITIEIHKIPQDKTAEVYAKELTDKIIGTCSYNIIKKQISNYVSFEPMEANQEGCFVGLIIPTYNQYSTRTDLLINFYWVPDPFLNQQEIDNIIASISVK